ncbi:MAG: hypothetical protein Q4G64_05295 [bacterium]|nr:hypothetical protein [bacterium]
MTFDKYEIDAEAALGAIRTASSRFDDIHDLDGDIKASFDAAAATIGEGTITAALNSAFTDHVEPIFRSMVWAGANLFACGETIVATFSEAENAQTDIAKTQSRAVETMEGAVDQIGADPPPASGLEEGGAGYGGGGGGGTSAGGWDGGRGSSSSGGGTYSGSW